MEKKASEISIPVEKNKDYVINITGLTSEGMGVGKIEGFTIFVEGALPEEQAEIKIVKLQKTYGYGRLLRIIKESSARIEPKCGIVKRCGGCQLQHLSYEQQLTMKTQSVKDAIERIGGLYGITIHNTLGMKEPWRYRNKAQFPIGMDKDVAIGFYANRTHQIIDTGSCIIQDELNDKVIELLRGFIKKHNLSVYNEETGKGLLRHIMTRKGFKTGEVMICLVINGDKLQYGKELVELFTDNVQGLKSIVLNINKKKTNVIMGDKSIVIYGSDHIIDYIGEFKFKISPLSFFQVNPIQTEVLYAKALEYASLTGKETVIDAYCGIGTISLFLSKKAKKVYGVEIVPQAIENAKENAKINDIENAEFILGESETVIPELYKKGLKADVIVVDPPRKGCGTELLEVIADMKPDRVVYVSCNPSTLARDLRYLDDRGYKTVEVQPVDMFAHTGHVETVVLMTYCGSKEKR